MDQQDWYYQLNSGQVGPVSKENIIELLTKGALDANTLVWTQGMGAWLPVAQVPELMAVAETMLKGRPTSVTVFGILNIVFGGLALLCSPLAIISLVIPQPNQAIELSDAMKFFSFFSYGLGFVMSIVLLASGIGLLYLKQWARKTACFYGWFAIIWGVLSVIINIFLFTTDMAITGEQSPEMMGGIIGGIVGGMCGGIIGLIYPVLMLVFLRKPHIVQACSK